MFHKVFGFLEHTNNCYIFSISFQNDRNETKLTCDRGFRWIAGSTSIDSIRRPGVLADLDPLDLDPPGPNPLADMDPPDPNPLAYMDSPVQIRWWIWHPLR